MTDMTKNVDLFTVVRAGHYGQQTGQTAKAKRETGVGVENTPATKLWYGRVTTGPGEVSDPHHHGEAETGGYVLKGKGFIRFGEGYGEVVYLNEGDFCFVPPYMPHIEGNCSTTEELIWLTTRTPDNIVVNLENQEIADIEIEMS